MAKKRFFISYSHVDSELVEPLVQLLKVGGRYVFRDIDSIEPGKRWEDAIDQGIKRTNYFVLLWCCHSATSEQVSREIHVALETHKALLPILLCSVDVPPPIDQYQWIDLRANFNHSCCDHSGITILPYDIVPFQEVLARGARLESFDDVAIARAWKRATDRSLQGGERSNIIALTLGVILLALSVVKPFLGPFSIGETQAVNMLAAGLGILATFISTVRILKIRRRRAYLLKTDRRSQLLGLTVNCLIKVVESGGMLARPHS